MPPRFLASFPHDAFVSYAHLDNTGERWVSNFVRQLTDRVNRRLGSESDIWMDPRLEGNLPLDQIFDLVRGCPTLVLFMSPSYLRSPWCVRGEANQFMALARRSANEGRVFVVNTLDVDRRNVPAFLSDLPGYCFFANDEDGVISTLPLEHPAAQKQLDKLANELALALKGLAEREPQPRATTPTRKIYLADATEDLLDQRTALEDFFLQHGCQVVPEMPLVGSLNEPMSDYADRVTEAMENGHLFVQLLSDVVGRRAIKWDRSYPRVQLDCALARGLRVMQWAEVLPDVNRIADPKHRDMLTSDSLITGSIEQFKTEVQRVLDQPAEPKPPEPYIDPVAFVNAEAADADIMQQICELLERERVSWRQPQYVGDPQAIRERLELNLRDCDGVLLVYGKAPENWVLRQLSQAKKALAERVMEFRGRAIYDAPPADKPPMTFRELKWDVYNCRDTSTIDEQRIRQFAQALRGPS